MLQKAKPENVECIDRLVSALAQLQSDELISWARLHEISGPRYDLQDEHNHLLKRAMAIVKTEQGVTFQNIPGSGYKRMPRALAYKVGAKARESAVRKAKKAKKDIANVIAKRGNDMSETDTKRAIAEMCGLGAIANVGGNHKAAAQMRQSMADRANVAGPLPKFDLLKAFRQKEDTG